MYTISVDASRRCPTSARGGRGAPSAAPGGFMQLYMYMCSCMCVYLYIYIYMLHIYIYICIHTYIHTYIHTRMLYIW